MDCMEAYQREMDLYFPPEEYCDEDGNLLRKTDEEEEWIDNYEDIVLERDEEEWS